jgi:ribonuclease BN (tRNA processing enzyme)
MNLAYNISSKEGDIMKVTLYGVMGSMPGGESNLGKNSTCLVLEDGQSIIIDAGTGIQSYLNSTTLKHHHVLFTHYHLDHIIGLPYVKSLFDTSQSIDMYGPKLGQFRVSNLLDFLLVNPLLPISKSEIEANIHYHTIHKNRPRIIQGFRVTSYSVNHPGGCIVYRLTKNEKSISILTDLPNHSEMNLELIEFCRNSDLIYADATFLESEVSKVEDFGHSSLESVIKLFSKSESKQLIIGHHLPNRQLESLQKYESDTVSIAIEGTELTI